MKADFLSNRPLGEDLLDGQSQDYVAKAIMKHIKEVDAEEDHKNALPRIIGVEGTWGSGKSNMLVFNLYLLCPAELDYRELREVAPQSRVLSSYCQAAHKI